MPGSPMAAVERPRVAGEERAHRPHKWTRASTNQEVGMVGQECPGVHADGAGLGQRRQTPNEVGPILVIPEDRASFEPSHHHVVEDAGCIETWTTGHEATLS